MRDDGSGEATECNGGHKPADARAGSVRLRNRENTMIVRILLSALLAVLISAPVLAAQCEEDIKRFDNALNATDLSNETATEAKRLRYSADIKRVQGDEKECLELITKAMGIVKTGK